MLRSSPNHYKLPTELHNDANAAGLAEAIWGSGAEYDCVFYATIGTGIGTAILFDRHCTSAAPAQPAKAAI